MRSICGQLGEHLRATHKKKRRRSDPASPAPHNKRHQGLVCRYCTHRSTIGLGWMTRWKD